MSTFATFGEWFRKVFFCTGILFSIAESRHALLEWGGGFVRHWESIHVFSLLPPPPPFLAFSSEYFLGGGDKRVGWEGGGYGFVMV